MRYLDPRTGHLYLDAGGAERVSFTLKPLGGAVWSGPCGCEFAEDRPRAIKPEAYGYLVCSPNGPAKVLHPTREEAEQEALRLAKGNVAVEFTVVPVYLGDPVAKAYTPKPAPKLERF